MQGFNATDPLLDSLRQEAKEITRYPVRFILVQGLDAWRKLVEGLRLVVDEVFVLSPLCADQDTFPYLGEIIPLLKEKTGKVLVLPLAECLRFNGGFRAVLRELAIWEELGNKRVYIPLLGVNDIFENEMSKVTRARQGTLPEVLSLKGSSKMEVLVLPFKLKRDVGKTAMGIKAYLETWERGGRDEFILVTRCAAYLSGRMGNFEVRVYQNGYEFLKEQAHDFTRLRPEWGNERQWQWLAEEIMEHEDLDALSARLLNVNCYDMDQLFSRWGDLDSDQKWLFWVWSKLRVPTGTLFELVLKDSMDVNQLAEAVANKPFKEKFSLRLLVERRELLKRMGTKEMPPSFWELFKKLPDPLIKLQSLAGLTGREKMEVIRAIKELLESGAEKDAWWSYLEVVYPELADYLAAYSFEDDFLTEYFCFYNLSRILDSPRDELLSMARKAAEEKKIWSFPTRESVLEKYPRHIFKFWIDGMGLEWLSLWKGLLSRHEEIKLEVTVARTNLPTTTEYNKGWQKEEEVDRRLDELAHKYNYQYPASLVEEIKVISEDVEKLVQLLKERSELIVTSDHGLTRFAFAGGKSSPPEGAQVHKWGRYAELKESYTEETIYSPGWVIDGEKIFLAVHEKFEGGNWSIGEVHGGATLEECLVPVIRLWKIREEELKARPEVVVFTPLIKLNVKGEGILVVELTSPVEKISLRVAGQVYPGTLESGQKSVFRIRNLKAGRYLGRLEYEGGLLGEIKFEMIRGLVEEDLGL